MLYDTGKIELINYKIYLDFSSLNLYKFNIRLDNLDSVNDINKIYATHYLIWYCFIYQC